MTKPSTRSLLIAATLLAGILAGATADRGIIGYPAWRALGVASWVAYSQHADLSLRGMMFYPVLAIGGTLFNVAAAFRFRSDLGASRSAALPIYASSLLAIGGLLLTIKAAPFMLSVAHAGNDEQAVQHAFDGFYFWSAIRGTVQILAFVTNVWALAALANMTGQSLGGH